MQDSRILIGLAGTRVDAARRSAADGRGLEEAE
jgi:hypothetical protein